MLKVILIIVGVGLAAFLINDLIQFQMAYTKRRKELHEQAKKERVPEK